MQQTKNIWINICQELRCYKLLEVKKLSTKNIDVPFLPQPKKIVLNGKKCHVQGSTKISTNVIDSINFDYLFSLAGFFFTKKEDIITEDLSVKYLIIGNIPEHINLKPDNSGEEAYALETSEDTIIIAANTEKGLALGVKLIVRLNKYSLLSEGLYVQDYPDVDFRGVHMCLFRPNDGTEKEDTDLESVRRRLIVASLANYNYVFLEFWGMFPYKKQPFAKWPEAYTWDEVQSLVDFVLYDLHMIPCPIQNMTSHAAWSRLSSRQHVMLDQHPEKKNLYIQGGWCFATEREETKAFLRDVMDDLIEMFHNPPLFHCSCDKCFGFGSEEEDRTKPADVLFVRHISFLHDYLASKGVRMVMWSDMLYSSMDTMIWKCAPSTTDFLPKDILINIWTHNDPGNYWNDIDFFESKGFQTIYSPFFNKAGAGSMVKLCKQHHSLGILQTTWHKPETALNTIAYTGGIQWGDVSGKPDEENRLSECINAYSE